MGLSAWEQRHKPVRTPQPRGIRRRKLIYDYIINYAETIQSTPTINEIAVALKLDYKVTYYHVMKLIAAGMLRQERNKLVVTGSQWIAPPDADDLQHCTQARV